MLSIESFEQLLSGKNITELCTLKNAFELLAGGRTIDSVASAEWAYIKGQLAVIEKGMWSILTGGSAEETATSIGDITNVDTAEKVKAQMETVLRDGIERGVEQPIIDKLNSLIDLAASKVTELAAGVKDKTSDFAGVGGLCEESPVKEPETSEQAPGGDCAEAAASDEVAPEQPAVAADAVGAQEVENTCSAQGTVG